MQQEQPTSDYGGDTSSNLNRHGCFANYLTVSGFNAATPAHLAIKLLIISLKINPKLFYARTLLSDLFILENRLVEARAVFEEMRAKRLETDI
jgi:hypothetical protein